MTGKTPEQINRIVDGISNVLPNMGNPDDKKLVQEAIGGPVLSEKLQLGIGSAIKRARWQGVLDGIKYATGEGELPDIEEGLAKRAIMAKYLTPEVMRAVLGSRMDPQKGVGNNG